MTATIDSAIRDSDLESHTAKIRVIAAALHDLLMDKMYDHGPDEHTGWLHQVLTEALERESKAIDDIVFGPDAAPDGTDDKLASAALNARERAAATAASTAAKGGA